MVKTQEIIPLEVEQLQRDVHELAEQLGASRFRVEALERKYAEAQNISRDISQKLYEKSLRLAQLRSQVQDL